MNFFHVVVIIVAAGFVVSLFMKETRPTSIYIDNCPKGQKSVPERPSGSKVWRM